MAYVSGETNARRQAPSIGPLLLRVAAFFVTATALAEDGPDADYMRLRTVAISVQYYDGQDWKTYPKGLGTGFLVHPGGYVLTAKHVAPDERVSDPKQRTSLRIFGRIGDRSSAEMPLQIVGVHPQRDAMLLKFHRESHSKPLDYLELTDRPTLPLLQVAAVGFPASRDGKIRILTAHMTSDLGESMQVGEAGAKLEGGFSGGPVFSGGKVVGLIDSSSTFGQRDTFNFVPIRSIKGWLSENISLPKPVQGSRQVTLKGPARLELIKHLDDRWSNLRIFFDVPRTDVSKWPKGEEPERLLDWLEQRNRFNELLPAFKALNYDDLIKYLPDGGANSSGTDSTAPSAPVSYDDGKINDLYRSGFRRRDLTTALSKYTTTELSSISTGLGYVECPTDEAAKPAFINELIEFSIKNNKVLGLLFVLLKDSQPGTLFNSDGARVGRVGDLPDKSLTPLILADGSYDLTAGAKDRLTVSVVFRSTGERFRVSLPRGIKCSVAAQRIIAQVFLRDIPAEKRLSYLAPGAHFKLLRSGSQFADQSLSEAGIKDGDEVGVATQMIGKDPIWGMHAGIAYSMLAGYDAEWYGELAHRLQNYACVHIARRLGREARIGLYGRMYEEKDTTTGSWDLGEQYFSQLLMGLHLGDGVDVLVEALIETIDSDPPTKKRPDAKSDFDYVEYKRLAAVDALGRIGPDAARAVPVLLARLKRTDDKRFHAAVLKALGEMGKSAQAAIPALSAMLGGASVSDRVGAAAALIQIRPESNDVVPCLIKVLDAGDVDDGVRKRAIETLSGLGSNAKDATPAIMRFLDNDTLQAEAAIALGKIGRGAARALPGLSQLTRNKNRIVQVRSALAVYQISGDLKETVPILLGVLSDKKADKEAATAAIYALGLIGPPVRTDAIPAIVTSLARGGEIDRREATLALKKFWPEIDHALPSIVNELEFEVYADSDSRQAAGSILQELYHAAPANHKCFYMRVQDLKQRSVNTLIQKSKDKSDKARLVSMKGLADVGPPAAAVIGDILALLDDEDEVCEYALRAIGSIGPAAKDCHDKVAQLLVHKKGAVRSAAAYALRETKAPASIAVPALIRSLRTPEDEKTILSSRENVVYCLGEYGPEAAGAVKELTTLLATESDYVRLQVAAVTALGKIGAASSSSVPVLIKKLGVKEFVDDLEKEVVITLGKIGPEAKECIPLLRICLSDENQKVAWGQVAEFRCDVALAMHRITRQQEEPIGILLGMLDTVEASSKQRDSLRLSSEGKKRFADAEMTQEKVYIITTIGEFGPSAVGCLPIVTSKLRNDNASVRIASASAYYRISHKSVPSVDVLREIVKNTQLKEHERGEAARALGKMGRDANVEGVAEVLAAALDHEETYFDFSLGEPTAEAIGLIGAGKEVAVASLRKALNRTNHYVRDAAAKSLILLGKPLCD